ncbi:MAG: hypothetical protein CMJ76_09995 [Planctomycetaceae bacterium]|nr:hypothetical protein [Planctomycetaceae bacterium]|tara:strand:- start:830 stop:2215 length:1386 start_codon:yes stop_codon:yes gene_type:complete
MFQRIMLAMLLILAGIVAVWGATISLTNELPADREEVVFWHFWSGPDGEIVDEVVTRFNQSQDMYYVRAVSMPGNNFDMKLFLSITGGAPPDLINQDDPIVADWAFRGAIYSMEEIAPPGEVEQMKSWLLPSALSLGEYNDRLFAVCNGLDIRALYFNRELVEQALAEVAPVELESVEQLDRIAELCTKYTEGELSQIGYLPDPRRLWAWGPVFGGDFYDEQTGQVTANDESIVKALDWMTGYRKRLGANAVATYRQNDQSLPNKMFPLLAQRYAVILDGQWRVRDIEAAQQASRAEDQPVTPYGVWPLPSKSRRGKAGWVNGNVFLVPRHAKNPKGAWEFIKFWTGMEGHEKDAAKLCAAGGWIPVSKQVAESEEFQTYLNAHPLFARFVEFAATDQVPTPLVPGANRYYREVNNLVQRVLYDDKVVDLTAELSALDQMMQEHIDRIHQRPSFAEDHADE